MRDIFVKVFQIGKLVDENPNEEKEIIPELSSKSQNV